MFSHWLRKSYGFFFGIIIVMISQNLYAATYYSSSTASNPNLTTNWWTNTNNTGTNPANFLAAADIFIIQAGHTYTTTAAWNVTGTVQVAGNLTIGTANSITNLTIVNGGLVTGNAQSTIAGTFTIQDGGKYILNHNTSNNGGTTFSGTQSFSTNSTFEYQTLTAVGFTSGITYGTLIYNFNASRIFPATITIKGNFEMKQGTLDFSSARTIGGNFIQSGGTALLKSSTINGNYNQTGGTATLESSTIKGNMLIDGASAVTRITQSTSTNVDAIIEGDLEVKNGTFQMNDGLQDVINYATDLFIYGHFIVNGGTFNYPTLSTTRVAGRVFVNKDVRFLSGTVGGFLSTSTATAGLYFEGPNEQTFINAFFLNSLKDAFYYKTPPPATFFLNEQYIGTSGQQSSVNGSFGTPRVGYDRWPPATTTNIIRTFTINNPDGVLLRDSRNIRDTLYRTIGSIVRDNSDGDVEVISYSTGATLEYNGTSAITSEDMEFPTTNGPTNLNINNPGSVTLHSSRSLNGSLIFSVDNGLLNTTACNANTSGSAVLTLNDGATVTGEGDKRFVNGVMTKTGNDAFEFPIGELQGTTYKYAPVQISEPTNLADSYSACYIGSNPGSVSPSPGYDPTSRNANLLTPEYKVSTCEYWHYNKAGTSTDVQLTLSWAYGRSCSFRNADSLVVTNWLTSTTPDEWSNLFNNGSNTPGPGTTQTFGWVTSKDPVNIYGTFTLARPRLATFVLNNNRITLQGKIFNNRDLMEWNLPPDCYNASIFIEHSYDGKNYRQINQLTPDTWSIERKLMRYEHNINNEKKRFYRLKIVTAASGFFYSNTIQLNNAPLSNMQILPNPATDKIMLTGNTDPIRQVIIYNQMGQAVFSMQGSGNNSLQIPVEKLQNGLYNLRVLSDKEQIQNLRFIKQ